MTWSPSSPVTGGVQTGFTTPTYTLSVDTAPDVNGKQHAVTTLGGTQAGVRLHAVSDPFTLTFYRPKILKTLPAPNAITGKVGTVPTNTYGLVVRKGVNFAVNNAPIPMIIRCTMDVPAGSDAYDAANVRACISLAAGALMQQAQGVGDTLASGIF